MVHQIRSQEMSTCSALSSFHREQDLRWLFRWLHCSDIKLQLYFNAHDSRCAKSCEALRESCSKQGQERSQIRAREPESYTNVLELLLGSIEADFSASRHDSCSVVQDLHDLHTFPPLQTQTYLFYVSFLSCADERPSEKTRWSKIVLCSAELKNPNFLLQLNHL